MGEQKRKSGITRAEALQLLEGVPLFRGLAANELFELFREVKHREIAARTLFHDPSDVGEALYVLKKGSVRLYRLTRSGQKIPLMDLTAPTVFGSMGAFGQRIDGEFAETVEKSVLCTVSKRALERLIQRRPDVALRLLDLLGRRLSTLEGRLEEMAAFTAEQRLAAVMLRLADGANGIVSGLTQDELAEVSGTVRQTVARILGCWRDSGIVSVKRRSVRVLSRSALAELASPTLAG
ncbi:Crp/Fnr family transcriptional regulator [bacterium]|nr:MAG: Crp/Fnr family transcriptional regulator [bacterium]